MIPQEIKTFLKKKKELDDHVSTMGKKSLNGVFREVFDKDEAVDMIRWTQYTPHFNDGEPCVFGIRSVYIHFEGHDEGGDYDNGFLDAYELNGSYNKPSVGKALNTLDGMMNDLEDVFNTVFGDGVEVTVHRSGKIDVDTIHVTHD